jgi:hypothetical protein
VKLNQSLGVAAWAWRGAFSMMLRPITWVPFLVVTATQFAVLAILVFFDRPLILPLGLPLVQRLGGEAATHYPVFYYALPTLFSRANLVIGALVASVAGGAATLLFAHFWGLGRADGAWRRSLRAAPTLIPLTLLVIGIIYGVDALIRLVPREVMLGSAAVRWGTRAGMLAAFIIVESLFGYTTAWVVLMGHNFLKALRDSIKVTWITLLPTLVVVALPAVVLFPISYAMGRVDLIAQKLRPETTLALVSAQIILELFCTFVLAGSLVRLFVWRMEAGR